MSGPDTPPKEREEPEEIIEKVTAEGGGPQREVAKPEGVRYTLSNLDNDAGAARIRDHEYNKYVAIRRLWRDGKPETWGGGRALEEAGRMLRARKLSHIKAVILARGTVKFCIHVGNLFDRWEYVLNPNTVRGLGDYTAPRPEGHFPKLVLSPYYQMFQEVRALVISDRNEFFPPYAQRELNVAALMVYSTLERARDYIEMLGTPEDIEARDESFYASNKARTAPDAHDKEILRFIDEFMLLRLYNPELDEKLEKDVEIFSDWARRNHDC